MAGSGLPWTTLRATQFHTLSADGAAAGQLPAIPVAAFRFQPVDPGEVADRLVELALGDPAGLVPDLAGPRIYGMGELIRGYLRARGCAGRSSRSGPRPGSPERCGRAPTCPRTGRWAAGPGRSSWPTSSARPTTGRRPPAGAASRPGRRSGSRTWNGAPPPGRSCTPPGRRGARRSGPPATGRCRPRGVGTRPAPGGTARTGWPAAPGHAAAGVLDGQQDPLVPAGDPDPHRGVGGGVAAGVGQQVLDHPLHLGRVHPGHHRLDHQLQPPPAALPPLLGDPADQGGQVGGAAAGSRSPCSAGPGRAGRPAVGPACRRWPPAGRPGRRCPPRSGSTRTAGGSGRCR